jgi:hypothetical protein
VTCGSASGRSTSATTSTRKTPTGACARGARATGFLFVPTGRLWHKVSASAGAASGWKIYQRLRANLTLFSTHARGRDRGGSPGCPASSRSSCSSWRYWLIACGRRGRRRAVRARSGTRRAASPRGSWRGVSQPLEPAIAGARVRTRFRSSSNELVDEAAHGSRVLDAGCGPGSATAAPATPGERAAATPRGSCRHPDRRTVRASALSVRVESCRSEETEAIARPEIAP